MSARRSFLRQFGLAAGLMAVPEIVTTAAKFANRRPFPSALRVSVGANRPGWAARCLRLGARVRTIRSAAAVTGVTVATAFKAAFRGGITIAWRAPVLRPSLRNILDGSAR